MTGRLYLLIGAAAALSLGHHVDHILRGAVGWPLSGEVSPFTFSLLVYPAIVIALALSRRGRAGPRFWALFSASGALFVLAVHFGPAADDTVTKILDEYPSPGAGAVALGELGLFVTALAGLSLYDVLLWRRSRRSGPRSPH